MSLFPAAFLTLFAAASAFAQQAGPLPREAVIVSWDGERLPGILTSVDGDGVLLDVGGERMRVDAESIRRIALKRSPRPLWGTLAGVVVGGAVGGGYALSCDEFLCGAGFFYIFPPAVALGFAGGMALGVDPVVRVRGDGQQLDVLVPAGGRGPGDNGVRLAVAYGPSASRTALAFVRQSEEVLDPKHSNPGLVTWNPMLRLESTLDARGRFRSGLAVEWAAPTGEFLAVGKGVIDDGLSIGVSRTSVGAFIDYVFLRPDFLVTTPFDLSLGGGVGMDLVSVETGRYLKGEIPEYDAEPVHFTHRSARPMGLLRAGAGYSPTAGLWGGLRGQMHLAAPLTVEVPHTRDMTVPWMSGHIAVEIGIGLY